MDCLMHIYPQPNGLSFISTEDCLWAVKCWRNLKVNHQSCPTQYVGHCLLIDKAVADQSEGARSGCVLV